MLQREFIRFRSRRRMIVFKNEKYVFDGGLKIEMDDRIAVSMEVLHKSSI